MPSQPEPVKGPYAVAFLRGEADAPTQFADFSTRSTTRISSGPFVAVSFRPSCCRTRVMKTEGHHGCSDRRESAATIEIAGNAIGQQLSGSDDRIPLYQIPILASTLYGTKTPLRESTPPAAAFLQKSLAAAETTLQRDYGDDHGRPSRCHSPQDRSSLYRPAYEDGKRDPNEDDEDEGCR